MFKKKKKDYLSEMIYVKKGPYLWRRRNTPPNINVKVTRIHPRITNLQLLNFK